MVTNGYKLVKSFYSLALHIHCNRGQRAVSQSLYCQGHDMAEVLLNPMFASLSGRVGDIVFYCHDGRTYFRAYVTPRNPDTPAQRSNRRLFAEAMNAWRHLSAFDQDSFRRRAGRLGMTGHNLFISRYMRSHAKNEAPGRDEDQARPDTRAFPGESPSLHGLSLSVCGSTTGLVACHGVSARDVSPPGALCGAD